MHCVDWSECNGFGVWIDGHDTVIVGIVIVRMILIYGSSDAVIVVDDIIAICLFGICACVVGSMCYDYPCVDDTALFVTVVWTHG